MKNQSPQDMMATVSDSMLERTGKSLEAWVEVVLQSGINPLDQNAVRKWLKAEHGIAQTPSGPSRMRPLKRWAGLGRVNQNTRPGSTQVKRPRCGPSLSNSGITSLGSGRT